MTRHRPVALVAIAIVAALGDRGVRSRWWRSDGAGSRDPRRGPPGPLSMAGGLVADTTDAEPSATASATPTTTRSSAWRAPRQPRETADPTHYAQAGAALDRALELDPQHLEALYRTGTLALARHDFAGALRSASERSPSTSGRRVHGVIADAQGELGRYDDALDTVYMVDLRPDLASYSRVSYLRELHGDLDGAIEAMEPGRRGRRAERREHRVRPCPARLPVPGEGRHGRCRGGFTLALERMPGWRPCSRPDGARADGRGPTARGHRQLTRMPSSASRFPSLLLRWVRRTRPPGAPPRRATSTRSPSRCSPCRRPTGSPSTSSSRRSSPTTRSAASSWRVTHTTARRASAPPMSSPGPCMRPATRTRRPSTAEEAQRTGVA